VYSYRVCIPRLPCRRRWWYQSAQPRWPTMSSLSTLRPGGSALPATRRTWRGRMIRGERAASLRVTGLRPAARSRSPVVVRVRTPSGASARRSERACAGHRQHRDNPVTVIIWAGSELRALGSQLGHGDIQVIDDEADRMVSGCGGTVLRRTGRMSAQLARPVRKISQLWSPVSASIPGNPKRRRGRRPEWRQRRRSRSTRGSPLRTSRCVTSPRVACQR